MLFYVAIWCCMTCIFSFPLYRKSPLGREPDLMLLCPFQCSVGIWNIGAVQEIFINPWHAIISLKTTNSSVFFRARLDHSKLLTTSEYCLPGKIISLYFCSLQSDEFCHQFILIVYMELFFQKHHPKYHLKNRFMDKVPYLLVFLARYFQT